MYDIPLPEELKAIILQYSDHIRFGKRSVRWILYQ